MTSITITFKDERLCNYFVNLFKYEYPRTEIIDNRLNRNGKGSRMPACLRGSLKPQYLQAKPKQRAGITALPRPRTTPMNL